jgi:hypothetical protein
MSLGGRLSLAYLLTAVVVLVCGGRHSEYALIPLGFPLVFLLAVLEPVIGVRTLVPPALGVTLLVLLWVANSYLWGHGLAAAFRVAMRRFNRPVQDAGSSSASPGGASIRG